MSPKTSSRFRHSPQSAWRRVESEAIVLDLETSVYYSLNEVGAYAWERLGEGKTVDDVLAAIVSEFDVAESTARKDLDELVAKLRERRLLEPA